MLLSQKNKTRCKENLAASWSTSVNSIRDLRKAFQGLHATDRKFSCHQMFSVLYFRGKISILSIAMVLQTANGTSSWSPLWKKTLTFRWTMSMDVHGRCVSEFNEPISPSAFLLLIQWVRGYTCIFLKLTVVWMHALRLTVEVDVK